MLYCIHSTDRPTVNQKQINKSHATVLMADLVTVIDVTSEG